MSTRWTRTWGRRIAAGFERRLAEEGVAEGFLEPPSELRLDVVLELEEQVCVADEIGDLHPAGLLLEGALDLLAEGVLEDVVHPLGV